MSGRQVLALDAENMGELWDKSFYYSVIEIWKWLVLVQHIWSYGCISGPLHLVYNWKTEGNIL